MWSMRTSQAINTSPTLEHHEVRSVVTDENLVIDMGLTKGLSGQDGHIEPSEVHLGAEQHVESIIGSISSDLTSGCVSPKEMSTTASLGSSENIRVSEKANLDTDMDATHGPSLVLPGAEHVYKFSGSVSSDSTSFFPCPEETSPTASMCSSEYNRDVLTLWSWLIMWNIRTSHQTEKAPSTLSPTDISQPAEHCEVRSAVMAEDLKTASSDLTPGCASTKEMSPTALIGSSEDIKAAEKAELSSVPLELVDVEDDVVTPEDVMEEFMEDHLVKVIDTAARPSLNIGTAMRADLSSFPVELVDVGDEDVTPEKKEDVATTSRETRRKT